MTTYTKTGPTVPIPAEWLTGPPPAPGWRQLTWRQRKNAMVAKVRNPVADLKFRFREAWATFKDPYRLD